MPQYHLSMSTPDHWGVERKKEDVALPNKKEKVGLTGKYLGALKHRESTYQESREKRKLLCRSDSM